MFRPDFMTRLLRGQTFILLGVACAVVGMIGIYRESGFFLRSVRVPTTVTEVSVAKEGAVPVVTATLAYTVDGVAYSGPAAPTFRPTAVGETIDAGYDPLNPADVRLMDPRDQWVMPGWATLFGALNIAVGIARLRRERQARAAAPPA